MNKKGFLTLFSSGLLFLFFLVHAPNEAVLASVEPQKQEKVQQIEENTINELEPSEKTEGMVSNSTHPEIQVDPIEVQPEQIEEIPEKPKSGSKNKTIDVANIKYQIKNHPKLFLKQAKDFYKLSDHLVPTREKTVQNLSKVITETHPESLQDFIELEALLKEKEPSLGNQKWHGVMYVVDALIEKWNIWPNGSLGKAMELAAKEEFKLFAANMDNWKYDEIGEYEAHLGTIGLVLHSMKQATSDYFQHKGIKNITLFRGLTLSEKMKEGVHSHRLSPMSSFSISKDIANVFSYYSTGDSKSSYVLMKSFPADRILSFAVTGLGTKDEYEFVVLGPECEIDDFYVLPAEKPQFDDFVKKGHSKKKKKALKKKIHKWVDTDKNKVGKKQPPKIDQTHQSIKPQAIKIKKDINKTSQSDEHSTNQFFEYIFKAIAIIWAVVILGRLLVKKMK